MLYNLFENRDFVSVFAVALLAEGVDRNVCCRWIMRSFSVSPSSRRAWIEIEQTGNLARLIPVALLAEGVDRNNHSTRARTRETVALLAEGVDRNDVVVHALLNCSESPSSRRAWIEITKSHAWTSREVVALLAEGVDRNTTSAPWRTKPAKSPSSRRAWIEIITVHAHARAKRASPSSRRAWIEINPYPKAGIQYERRPPRGGRG